MAHQAAVFCAASYDPALARLAPRMLVWSALLVVFQTLAAFGVFVGVFRAACASSDQCFVGSFCNIKVGRCDFCGGHICNVDGGTNDNNRFNNCPFALEIEGTCAMGDASSTIKSDACATYNRPEDPNFVGYNTTATKMVCADPTNRLYLGGDSVSSDGVRSWCDAW